MLQAGLYPLTRCQSILVELKQRVSTPSPSTDLRPSSAASDVTKLDCVIVSSTRARVKRRAMQHESATRDARIGSSGA